jgi:rubrerythrin
MPDDLTIEEVDRDGAVAEATEGLQQSTRAGLFRRIGLFAGGGVVAGAVPIALATGQGGGLSKRDVEILNYALTLEYLEAGFYAEANSKGNLTGVARTFSQLVGRHEAEHVTALQGVLGSKAVKKPSFDFKGSTNRETTFLKTARVLEDTGVAAYQGQAGRIESDTVLASAGSILAVEARHAAWVRDILGAGKTPSPAPAAFSKPMSMKQVLDAVEQTGFITS